MSARSYNEQLGSTARLDQSRADEIVRAARPHVEAMLRPVPEGGVRVSAQLVAPAGARGGSVIPAWPLRGPDGRVTIEFVADWGAMLASWCAALGDEAASLVDLVKGGERQWVGIANDVLQLYVPDPPAGTYSMVRHHALMLVAATLWLRRARAQRWLEAHRAVAISFLDRLGGGDLWDGVAAAERGLATLLADPRAHGTADEALCCLETDIAAATLYCDHLGAASLGLAALLATAPSGEPPADWVEALTYGEHPHPDFNRDRIEAFATRQRRTSS